MLAKPGVDVIGRREASPLQRGADARRRVRLLRYPLLGVATCRTTKTVRSNSSGAELAADHGAVFVAPQDAYEQLLTFYDMVGAALAGAHEKIAAHVDEYQSQLASGYDCLTRATYSHLDLVNAVACAHAELGREIADAYREALRDMLGGGPSPSEERRRPGPL